ncbi:MAG: class II histone deacetylase [Pseudomonadota bacterium]
MAKTGFVYHDLYCWHDTGNHGGFMFAGFPIQPGMHVEHPETKRRFKNLLDVTGMTEQLTAVKPRHATEEELRRFHTADYIDRVRTLSNDMGGDCGELTPIGRGGYEIALLSAGGVLEATEAVLTGALDNAYCLVRPPGHHADAEQGRGFCVFGNGVIAIKDAMARHGLSKVAILDWDVHHGNSAETAFYDDPSVLTISMHQENWFPPGRGFVEHNGEGRGEGYAINVPLPPGSGVGAYLAAFDRIVEPALRGFAPEAIFIGCGFDASALDPMGRMMVHSECFRDLAKRVLAIAGDVCGGKIVFIHEGGYSPFYVPFCGLATVEEMSGKASGVEDPYLGFAAGMGGQELQPAQDALITEIAERVLTKFGKAA